MKKPAVKPADVILAERHELPPPKQVALKRWLILIAAGFVIFAGVLPVAVVTISRSNARIHHAKVDAEKTHQKVVDDADDLVTQGKPAEAAKKLEAYAADGSLTDQRRSEALVSAGAEYEMAGDTRSAIRVYKQSADLPASQGGIAANEGLARAETKLGHKQQAIEYWRKCIELTKKLTDSDTAAQDIATYGRYITALGGKV